MDGYKMPRKGSRRYEDEERQHSKLYPLEAPNEQETINLLVDLLDRILGIEEE